MNTYEECRQCKLKMNAYKRKLNRQLIILVCGALIITSITAVVSASIVEKAAETQIHSLLQSQRETLEQIYSEQSKEVYNDDFFAPEYISMNLPVNADGSFKSYMDYRKITNKSSKQWNLQQLAVTDEFGMRRFNGNYLAKKSGFYERYYGRISRTKARNYYYCNAFEKNAKQRFDRIQNVRKF